MCLVKGGGVSGGVQAGRNTPAAGARPSCVCPFVFESPVNAKVKQTTSVLSGFDGTVFSSFIYFIVFTSLKVLQTASGSKAGPSATAGRGVVTNLGERGVGDESTHYPP